MAKVGNNILTQGLQGAIGGMLVFRQLNGKTVVSAKSQKVYPRSDKQKERQDRFRKATQYAKSAMADASLKEQYAAGLSPRCSSAYQVAVADYLNAPSITQVIVHPHPITAQKIITIYASDDFRVAEVTVSIHTADGEVQEEGRATPTATDGIWEYMVSSTTFPLEEMLVTVAAVDLPQNRTSRTVSL